MGFRFALRKNQKNCKPMDKYIIQRLQQQHKLSFEAQLERLDAQLQHENIDKIERDRLRTILEEKYYEQQLKN